jgi:hypothetical protein
VFENRVVRKIFLDEGGRYRRVEKITSDGTSCIVLLISYGGDDIKEEEMGQACDIYGGEVKYFHTVFWWGNLKERDRLEDLDLDGKVILKWILRKEDEVMWTGFVCSKKRTSRGIL